MACRPARECLEASRWAAVEGAEVAVLESIEELRDAAERLAGCGYKLFLSLIGVDEPEKNTIRLTYTAACPDDPSLVAGVEVEVPRDRPVAPSLREVWPGIDLQEREVHEMLGVVFIGQPDLRHLLLPPDWPRGVYPLRKDFRVSEEGFLYAPGATAQPRGKRAP